jgi:NifU-like protein involved in Fe-S cluster formation
LFARPAHAGCIDTGIRAQAEDQGVRMCLCATQAAGVVSELRFKAWGCPHVIAAAEAFCAEYQGRAVGELLEFSAFGLMQSLPVPVQKTGRILVLEDVVRSLGSKLQQTTEED